MATNNGNPVPARFQMTLPVSKRRDSFKVDESELMFKRYSPVTSLAGWLIERGDARPVLLGIAVASLFGRQDRMLAESFKR